MTGLRAHLARYLVLLAVVAVVTFFLPRLLPGSPLSGAIAGSGLAALPSATLDRLREGYDLNRPMREQFVRYLRRLGQGDLGRSISTHRPVSALIAERLPWTVGLAGVAIAAAALAGLAMGTWSAMRPGSRTAQAAGMLVIGLGALPEFLIAMGCIIVFGVRWRLFPTGGGMTPFGGGGAARWLADVAWHAALPAVTLVAALVPVFVLVSRNALAPVMDAPFLVVARAKGLRTRRILWHAWRNAMSPVLTLTGLRLAALVTGVVVVERVFAYPGIGMLLFEAVARRDYPVIQGVVLVSSIAVLTVVFFLEMLAYALDPRVREPG